MLTQLLKVYETYNREANELLTAIESENAPTGEFSASDFAEDCWAAIRALAEAGQAYRHWTGEPVRVWTQPLSASRIVMWTGGLLSIEDEKAFHPRLSKGEGGITPARFVPEKEE